MHEVYVVGVQRICSNYGKGLISDIPVQGTPIAARRKRRRYGGIDSDYRLRRKGEPTIVRPPNIDRIVEGFPPRYVYGTIDANCDRTAIDLKYIAAQPFVYLPEG
jgi:hypothetical protein